MLKADSEDVSIEQVCLWRESGRWEDHERAVYIGFADETLREVLSKHQCGQLRLSANVDGQRQDLDKLVTRDFNFFITWHRLVGAYLVGSRGTCAVRGASHDRFCGTALKNLNWPADGLTRSTDGTMVNGFHRLITNICLNRHEVKSAWLAPPPAAPGLCGAAISEDKAAHQEFFLKREFVGITICARQLNLSAGDYVTIQPDGSLKVHKRPFARIIRPVWDLHAKMDAGKHAGRLIFAEIRDEERFVGRCGAYLSDLAKRGWSDFPSVPNR